MSTKTDLRPLPLHAVWDVDCGDELFQEPYLDADELREVPVPHRWVHGGFRGTQARFSIYLPVDQPFARRFFQHVTPFPQSELLAPDAPAGTGKIAFAVASGAYFVETNSGVDTGGAPAPGADPTIAAYRANAAIARFSRAVAQEVFGEGRIHGYLYGGSGGAFRTIGASEATEGAWDGYVPHVVGSTMAMPNVFSVRMHAMRVLRDRFPEIVDAYDAGGDPSALDLTPEQREAFDEVTAMGFPPRSWFGWRTMGMHGFSALYPGVMAMGPSYSEDFWTVPGYLGADPESSVHRDRIQLVTRIRALIAPEAPAVAVTGGVDVSFTHGASTGAAPVAVRLADPVSGWALGAELHVRSGALAGSVLRLTEVDGDLATFEGWQDELLGQLAEGDEVVVDNSRFLAAQTYHRHQVPGPGFPVWDQYRDEDGAPLLPQRAQLMGPRLTLGASGVLPTGAIRGRMIVVSCLLDREAFPWQADWYRAQVQQHLGEREEDRFRLWYVEGALHGDEDPQEFPARSVSYLGVLETALLQLSDWVERGIAPSPTTRYEIRDGQVIVPEEAGERGGVQPTIDLRVDGGERTEVRIGQEVAVEVRATAPGDGVIVELREVLTDADGTEHLAEEVLPITPAGSVAVRADRAIDVAGTHMIAVRVRAQTRGDAEDPWARVQNIARARVVVG